MPTRPPRAHPNGRKPTPSAPRPRVSARKRGYDTKWDKARAGFLAKHRFCECPDHKGKPNAPLADTIDHIVAHKGDHALFWDRQNWCAVARGCNARKAAREEGAFGNPRRAQARPGGGIREKGFGLPSD